MELRCSVRLVTIFIRNSFERPVPSVLSLGIRARDPLDPLLILITTNVVLEFKVTNNVKRLYKKELAIGRLGIEFYSPPHHLLICVTESNSGETTLHEFLSLLDSLKDRSTMEQMEYIPLLRNPFIKPSRKTGKCRSVKSTHSSVFDSSLFVQKRKKCMIIPKNIKEKLSQYLKEIQFPDCQLKEIPVKLGEITLEILNLENNNLTNDSLTWLEEIPIRKSLQTLNLAENKLESFPSVLIDFHSIVSLNFRDNEIRTIPGSIDELKSLKYLNLSGNKIQYLPASFSFLRLREADLTYNNLTSNVRSTCHPSFRWNSKNCLRLMDLAAMSVDSSLRCKLSGHNYPEFLLNYLRNLSKCVCGKKTVPNEDSQFYEVIFRIKFALIFNIHPQKVNFENIPLCGIRHKGDGRGNIFLQFHLCSNCKDKYLICNYRSEFHCFQLVH